MMVFTIEYTTKTIYGPLYYRPPVIDNTEIVHIFIMINFVKIFFVKWRR